MALYAFAAGCSSGTPAASLDAGGLPLDSGAQPLDSGARPLEGGGSIRTLPLSTNDLVFDPTRHVLYATMNPTTNAGNSVITIDPASATVTGALSVGGLPNVLAISDDGSALYVGTRTPAAPPSPTTPEIDGADSVRRIDLASMTVGPTVSLGSNVSSTLTVGQLAAVPGSSTQYVVSRRQPGVPTFAGLALYDGGTRLAELNYPPAGDSITFTGPSTLFGCSNNLNPSELVRFSLTPTTITAGNNLMDLITGAERTRIIANGGWIFATDGQVVSAATMAAVGTYNDSGAPVFPGGGSVPSTAVLPDADGANVWFLRTADAAKLALLDFDRTTFQLLRSISLAPVAGDVDLPNATPLVRWSPTGLAFRTFYAVYLITVPD